VSTDTSSVAAHQFALDALRDTLGKSTDVDSCLALSRRINGLIDEATAYFEKEGSLLACRAGCSFCCHLRVMVYPHEAIALFRYLGSRIPKEQADGIRERLVENAAGRGRLEGQARDADSRLSGRIACAFLVDGKCSAYEVRPAACSGYHSTSRERCENDFNGTNDSPEAIPMLQGLHFVATALDQGLDLALADARLWSSRIELHQALAALIRDPALIARWRSGRELLPRG
jgi:Fe-S-cluster containining protein